MVMTLTYCSQCRIQAWNERGILVMQLRGCYRPLNVKHFKLSYGTSASVIKTKLNIFWIL